MNGMELEIAGRKFYVAGVVERDSDFASKEAYGADIGLYMAYDVFNEITDKEINCYELVFPNPVTNFALNLVKENFGNKETTVYVDEGSRYGVSNLWSVVKDYGKRSMRTDGVIFPYWENAARLTEDYAALCMVLCFLFLAVPAGFAAVIACKYAKKGAALAWQKTEKLSVKFYDSVNDKLYAKEQHAKVLERQAAEEKRAAERAAESSEDYSEESSEDYEPDELDD